MLRVQIDGVRLLLTGDAEPEAQSRLLRTGADLRADVLKIPHHGSARQDPAFLAAIGARVAVASAGADNDYGHPAPRTIQLVQSLGMACCGPICRERWRSPRGRADSGPPAQRG